MTAAAETYHEGGRFVAANHPVDCIESRYVDTASSHSDVQVYVTALDILHLS